MRCYCCMRIVSTPKLCSKCEQSFCERCNHWPLISDCMLCLAVETKNYWPTCCFKRLVHGYRVYSELGTYERLAHARSVLDIYEHAEELELPD